MTVAPARPRNGALAVRVASDPAGWPVDAAWLGLAPSADSSNPRISTAPGSLGGGGRRCGLAAGGVDVVALAAGDPRALGLVVTPAAGDGPVGPEPVPAGTVAPPGLVARRSGRLGLGDGVAEGVAAGPADRVAKAATVMNSGGAAPAESSGPAAVTRTR